MSRKYTAKTSRSQTRRGREKGLFKLAANPKRRKLSATATEEHDWSNDVPSIKLSTAFLVILALHIALVVGVLVFRQFGGPVAASELGDSTSSASSAAATPDASPSSTSAINSVGASFRPNSDEFDGHIKHRVRPLENLDEIAAEYTVSKVALEKINKIGVDNPFRTGMLLVIPPREVHAVRPDATAVASNVSSDSPSASTEVRRATPASTASTQTSVRRANQVGTTTTAATAAGTHTVSSGETLWGISQKCGVTPDAIMKANGIKDARSLKIGAVLKIPSKN